MRSPEPCHDMLGSRDGNCWCLHLTEELNGIEALFAKWTSVCFLLSAVSVAAAFSACRNLGPSGDTSLTKLVTTP